MSDPRVAPHQGVVLIAYACIPGRGSEPGVGWHFLEGALRSMGASGRVVLLTQGRHVPLIRSSLSAEQRRVLEIIPVALPAKLDQLREANMRLHYCMWGLWAIGPLLRRLKRGGVAAVHHVTFATASLPSPLWLVSKRFRRVLGPVGALTANTLEKRLSRWRAARWISLLVEHVTLRRCDLVLAQNPRLFMRASRLSRAVVLEPNPVVAVSDLRRIGSLAHPHDVRHTIRVIAVGGLIERKRFDLIVKSLAYLPEASLTILGDGPLGPSLRKLIAELRLDGRCRMAGQVSRQEVLRTLERSDVLVLPSNNESAGWVVAEAATLGVPSVVIRGVGAEGIVKLSSMGRVIEDAEAQDPQSLAEVVRQVADEPRFCSLRWLDTRLPRLLTSAYFGTNGPFEA